MYITGSPPSVSTGRQSLAAVILAALAGAGFGLYAREVEIAESLQFFTFLGIFPAVLPYHFSDREAARPVRRPERPKKKAPEGAFFKRWK